MSCLIFETIFLSNVEMLFTGKENAFCVLEYARSQSNKTVQHVFMREFLKNVANSNADLDMAQKIQRGSLFVQNKRTTKKIRRDGRACSLKILQSSKKSLR